MEKRATSKGGPEDSGKYQGQCLASHKGPINNIHAGYTISSCGCDPVVSKVVVSKCPHVSLSLFLLLGLMTIPFGEIGDRLNNLQILYNILLGHPDPFSLVLLFIQL